MRKTSLTLLYILFFSQVFSQDFQTEYQAGIGYYKMEELRSFIGQTVGLLPFEPEIMNDFPPFVYHRPAFVLIWDRIEFGLSWSRLSTGLRYSLKDYSGEYLLDSRISANQPALLFNVCLNTKHRLRFLIGNQVGWIASRMTLTEILYLDDHKKIDEEYILRSTDVSWEPGFKISYPLSVFQFHLYAGYTLQIKGKGLYIREGGEEIYPKYRGYPLHAGWTGLRWGGGVAISFYRLNRI
jgi:hypothetical protein